MPTPRVLILRAPGTNCDQETAFAFDQAGGASEIVHINRLLENPRAADDFQILCIPGGFSYGDDIAAGRILGNKIRRYLEQTIEKFKDDGKLILGICNGFQVLMKTGVLLKEADNGASPEATLTWNDSGKFEDRWVNLAVGSGKCVFLQGIEQLYLPVAHAEGKFVVRDDEALSQMQQRGQLAMRYASADSASGENGQIAYPENPNGSLDNVAGICDETGRVFGLMPHPERHIDPTHHPRWTRGELPEKGEGLQIFENAVGCFVA